MRVYISLTTSVTQEEIETILRKTSIDLLINIILESCWRAADINCQCARHKNKGQTDRAWGDSGLRDFEQISPIR